MIGSRCIGVIVLVHRAISRWEVGRVSVGAFTSLGDHDSCFPDKEATIEIERFIRHLILIFLI